MLTQSKRTLTLGLGLLLLAALALTGCGAVPGAQAVVTTNSNDANAYTISVNGSGKVSVTPDVALINLGVEAINPDPARAISDNTERMNAVINAIKALGVEAKDIQTTNFSMWIENIYDINGRNTGETRYHVINQISVKVRDIAKTGDVLTAALQAGANSVNGISFTVADQTAYIEAARAAAVANAKAKAEQLARGLGVSVGKVRTISEYSYTPVYAEAKADRALGMGGGASVPVETGQFEITVDVQVVFDIQQ